MDVLILAIFVRIAKLNVCHLYIYCVCIPVHNIKVQNFRNNAKTDLMDNISWLISHSIVYTVINWCMFTSVKFCILCHINVLILKLKSINAVKLKANVKPDSRVS